MKKDTVESNMKPRFLRDRLDIMGLVVGREREELTILQVFYSKKVVPADLENVGQGSYL